MASDLVPADLSSQPRHLSDNSHSSNSNRLNFFIFYNRDFNQVECYECKAFLVYLNSVSMYSP